MHEHEIHHDVMPYTLLFPGGYGVLRTMEGGALIALACRIATRLESETDPELTSHRGPILEACAGFVVLHGQFEAALRSRANARSGEKTARSRFARALGRTRYLASAVYDQDPAKVEEIFRPARRRGGSAPGRWRRKAPRRIRIVATVHRAGTDGGARRTRSGIPFRNVAGAIRRTLPLGTGL